MPETVFRFGHHPSASHVFIFSMALPFFIFRGINIKKPRGRIPFQHALPCVDISVSVLLIAMRLMLITENQIIDIRAVGLLGDSKMSHAFCTSFIYSLCIIISSYAKKANKIPVKLHKCNKFFISQTVTCHRSQTFGHNNTPPCRCSPISNLHDSCRWVFCLACLRFQRPCIPGRPAARCQNFPKSRTKNVG